MKVRRNPGWVLVTLMAMVLSACGGGSGTTTTEGADSANTTGGGDTAAFDELIAAAQAEGEVVFYTAFSNDVMDQLAQGFEDKYGITVSYQRSTSGETKARVEEELAAGRLATDVIRLSSDPLWHDKMIDYLAEPDPARSPALQAVPAELRHGTWTETDQAYYGFVYNTDELAASDVPTDVRDIVNLEGASGRLGTAHPATSNTYATWHTVLYDEWGQDEYEQFWTTFVKDLNGVLSDSSAPLVASVAAGELLIIGPTNYGQMSDLKAQGAPVEMAYIDPVLRVPGAVYTFKDAPHPNAAVLFIDWLLSEDGQTIICGGGNCGSHLDIPGEIELPSDANVIEAPVEKGAQFGEDYVIPFFNELTSS